MINLDISCIIYLSILFGGDMKNFFKNHRYTVILLFVFILLVILGYKVKEIFVPDEGKASYGERLRDISKHPISNEVFTSIEEEYAKDENVIKSSHRIQGKVVNIYMTFKENVSPKDAKALAEKSLSHFDEDTLGYYSIQYFLTKEDEKLNNFPIMGMKDPLSKGISWTKDREITVSDEDEE